MAGLDILCFNPFNLKNKIMKIEQKKIFRGPSKISKNVSWSINICLKYFMASTKTLWAPSYIHNVRSLGSNCLKVTLLFYFFSHIFLLYTFGFHICIFRPLGWLWLKNNFVYIWFSWNFSLQHFPARIQVEKTWAAQWLSVFGSFRLVSL